MRIFWIGLGSIAALTFVVVPYIANKQCKNRWPPQAEAFWDFQTGCMVKIRGIVFERKTSAFLRLLQLSLSRLTKISSSQSRF
jgi:hypothetical protein